MAGMIAITGGRQVIAKMRKGKAAHGRGVSRGLSEAGKFLFRESQAIVPVNEGHLKGSGFVRRFGVGFKTDVVVGYTADYAVYVHENLDALHGAQFNAMYPNKPSRGIDQQAKFLEKPARENRRWMLHLIAAEMRRG